MEHSQLFFFKVANSTLIPQACKSKQLTKLNRPTNSLLHRYYQDVASNVAKRCCSANLRML